MFRLCSLIVWWNWSMVILSMWNTYFYRIYSPGLIIFTRQKNFILWFKVSLIFERWSWFFFFGSGLVYFALILQTHKWFFISVVSWLNPSHWSFVSNLQAQNVTIFHLHSCQVYDLKLHISESQVCRNTHV